MASRPVWRGHLRLALVSCPVALVPARHERNNLRFNLINPETNNRVRMVTLDAETGEELERGALARGYEFKKDHYVLLTEEDFDSVRVDSSSTMSIDKFVALGSIDPLHFDAAYLVVPDGDVGRDVYAVLREAIARSKTIALSRIVIARRERTAAIVARGNGMVLHTLHEAEDIADLDDAFADVPSGKADEKMVRLAAELIERQTGDYVPDDLEDRYEAKLRQIIDAKVAGTDIDPDDSEPEDRGNVNDLMDALQRSLSGGGTRATKPAKPAAKRAGAASKRAAAKTRKAATAQPKKRATSSRARKG